MPLNTLNKARHGMFRSNKNRHLLKKRVANHSRALAIAESNQNEMLPNTKLIASSTGVTTNRVVSKKRAKKVARNKKFAAARNVNGNKLLVDLQAKQDSMEVDDEESIAESNPVDPVRAALWSVVEDTRSVEISIDSTGDGTTLGGPSF